MISSKTKTLEILNKNELFAKKKYGQNFLIDPNIVQKIAKVSEVDKNTGVIEIGPGIGAMTEVLCMQAKKVICFEIDEDMVNILNEELNFDNLEIVNIDFLKVDLDNYFNKFNDCEKVVVVSNLPYYITTPIIFKLLQYSKNIYKMVFMVQKEVSLRLTAKPNCKDYGSLSVLIKLNGDMKREFIVTRNCFYPAPNVDSEIVSMLISKNDCSVKNKPIFEKFIQNCFEMKRKTLVNNITNKYSISRDEITEILKHYNLSESVRSESLTLDQFINIYNELINNNKL